ncbi:MAG: hypothetical protein KDA75_17980, partial [Planctomycetaceae bacterium]|nr:hypothetical protein [Planctomycetaceae bacterium]
LQWLLSRWTSQEVLWQRLRAMTSDSPQQKLNPQILLANFEQAAQAAQAAENSAQAALSSTAAITPLETTNRQGSLRVGNLREILDQGQRNLSGIPVPSGTDQLSTEIARRWTQANRVSRLMERLDPSLFAQPEVQFVRAALLRGCEQPAEASEIYRRFFGFDEGVTPWNLAARGEIWVTARGAMSPKPVLRCQRAEVPPVLDGLLNDSCWAAASEVELTVEDSATDESDPNFVGSRTFNAANPDSLRRAPGGAAEAAIVMLSYDDKYLYLAGSVPRSPTGTTTPVKYAGRQHDTDLATFDRLRFAFDIDRDYTTWYRFDVDQRGATSEALWDDSHWNPQWFVAADAGPEHWRIEVAIPLEELTPKPPSRGDVWAAGITRVIPAEAIQGWTHPARLEPQGETFGLVQFD